MQSHPGYWTEYSFWFPRTRVLRPQAVEQFAWELGITAEAEVKVRWSADRETSIAQVNPTMSARMSGFAGSLEGAFGSDQSKMRVNPNTVTPAVCLAVKLCEVAWEREAGRGSRGMPLRAASSLMVTEATFKEIVSAISGCLSYGKR